MSLPCAPLKWCHPLVLFVTWFGSGLSPKAPGTMGTLAAVPFAWGMLYYQQWELMIALTVLFFFAGWWASNRYMKLMGKVADPKEIVIDEVVGYWLAVVAGAFFLPEEYLTLQMPLQAWIIIYALYLAHIFLFFRFFDILKPWPISLADKKLKGGFGVMLDDVLAGVAALVVFIFLQKSGFGFEVVVQTLGAHG